MKKIFKVLPFFLIPLLSMPSCSANGTTLFNQNNNPSVVEYSIYPNPRKVEYKATSLTFDKYVSLVINGTLDIYTVNKAYDVLALKDVKVFENNEHTVKVELSIYDSNIHTGLDYLATKIDAYYLDIDENKIRIIGKDSDAIFYGLETLKLIFEQSDKTVRSLTIEDYADTIYRGFIEGYYGIPWTSEERIELMRFSSNFKGNIYIYAPKDDPYHSSEWRNLYNDKDLKLLKDQIDAGNETKCTFAWSIHPFAEHAITQDNYTDSLATIKAKFDQIYNAGCRQFMVSGDDVPIPADADVAFMQAYGHLQRDLLNDLTAWNDEKGDCGNILYVPSLYSSLAEPHRAEYLAALVDNLSPKVEIMWTGAKITSRVSNGDFAAFKEMTGRDPFMWMNWPVNDYDCSYTLLGKGEVYDVKYEEGKVPFTGMISNPLQESEASKIGIFATLDYSWNTSAFNKDKSYVDGMKYIEPERFTELYDIAQNLVNPSGEFSEAYLEESWTFKPLRDAYTAAVESGQGLDEALENLTTYLQNLSNSCTNFVNFARNRRLVEEIKGWVLSLKDKAEAALLYLDLKHNMDVYSNEEIQIKFDQAEEVYTNSGNHTARTLDIYTNNIINTKVISAPREITPWLETLRRYTTLEVKGALNLPLGIIYEGIDGIYEGALENIMDGDDGTYCWFDQNLHAGAYILIDLEEEMDIYDLQILFGTQYEFKDQWTGVVQYSTSYQADTFVDIGTIGSTTYVKDFNNSPVRARFLRLYSPAGSEHWCSIKEIKINKLVRTVVYDGGVTGIHDGLLNNMFDGDETTYCWFNGKPTAGSSITYDIGSVIDLYNIYMVFGNAAGDDGWSEWIQYSEDGINFINVGDSKIGSMIFNYDFATPVKARYLRLYAEDVNATWVSIKEWRYNRVMTNGLKNPIYEGKVNDVFDNNLDSYLWIDGGFTAGGFILLDLANTKTINTLKFYFGNSNSPLDIFVCEVQYSTDGKNFTKICDIGAGEEFKEYQCTLETPIKARYIRLYTAIETTSWVVLREVEIN